MRHGGHLPDFDATYDLAAGWQLVEDTRLAQVLEMSRAGKSQRAIATALDLEQSTVSRMLKRANALGLARLNEEASRRIKDSPRTPRGPA